MAGGFKLSPKATLAPPRLGEAGNVAFRDSGDGFLFTLILFEILV